MMSRGLVSNAGAAAMPRPTRAGYEAPWSFVAVERHRERYLAGARRILGCAAQAEDVVQDVMLRLAADPPRMSAGSEGAYVGRMVRNLAIDRARRERFERRTFAPLDLTEAGLSSEAGTPETVTVSRESLRQVEAAVAELPEPARTAFRLHRFEGVPQTMIARRLGVSRALVCGLVRRGHLHCLAALDRRCAACPAGARAGAQPRQHQHEAERVGEELGGQPAREHAVVAEEAG